MIVLPPDEDVDSSRFVLFPIHYEELWQMYKTSQASFWTAEEIDFTTDSLQWSTELTEDERSFISVILAFFAASDGIVVENLALRFCGDVDIPEARCFYGCQIMMENVHSEVYSRAILDLVPGYDEQNRLLSAVKTIPAVGAKASWCLRWIEDKSTPFSSRLIAFAIVEGLFFSASFAVIFWLRSRRLMPGLTHSNELISRDEGLHTLFACRLYVTICEPVPQETVHAMVAEAVELEHAFFAAALPNPLQGMNVDLMRDYVEYVADNLLGLLGFEALYKKTNPFPFMDRSVVEGKANFFERPVSDYVGARVV